MLQILKKIQCLAIAVLFFETGVFAQFHKSTDNRVNHYLTFSLAGGGAYQFTHLTDDAPAIQDQLGADALFQFSYEMRKAAFFFGLGAQADYDFSRQYIDTFTHVFDRIDRVDEPVWYSYRYREYSDRQHTVQVSVPLYLGAYLGRYAYVMAGAKVSLALYGVHQTNTLLSTAGTYKRFIHTIENAPSYGYYAEDEYAFSGAYDAPSLKISPMVEAGARIPINSRSKRLSMRVGAYVEYGIPLAFTNRSEMVDYSRVTQIPTMLSKRNLQENIVFNPVLNTTYQEKAFSQLTIGLRWTLLINVTPPEHVCMCDADF